MAKQPRLQICIALCYHITSVPNVFILVAENEELKRKECEIKQNAKHYCTALVNLFTCMQKNMNHSITLKNVERIKIAYRVNKLKANRYF